MRSMLWAASQSHTLAHESGSLCSQALTLWDGTTRTGSLLRWAASTIRARSVREDRSSLDQLRGGYGQLPGDKAIVARCSPAADFLRARSATTPANRLKPPASGRDIGLARSLPDGISRSLVNTSPAIY